MDQNTPVPSHREVQVETYDRPIGPPVTIPPPNVPHRRPRQRHGPRWFVWSLGCLLAIVLLALLACALIGGLVMGIAFKLANEVTASSTTTQSFLVNDTPSLDIHNAAGHVRVQQGAAGTVNVQITRTARDTSQSAAQADLDNIVVTATQTGNQIAITSNFQDGGYFATANTVNLLITVPATTNIAADVAAGEVEINGVSGLMEISGGAGTVTLQDTALADGTRIHVATGTVTLIGTVPGTAAVDISVGTGDVTLRLPADTSTQLDARTNVGDIHITGWQVQMMRINKVGTVANGPLGTQPTATIHVRVDAGNISVSPI